MRPNMRPKKSESKVENSVASRQCITLFMCHTFFVVNLTQDGSVCHFEAKDPCNVRNSMNFKTNFVPADNSRVSFF